MSINNKYIRLLVAGLSMALGQDATSGTINNYPSMQTFSVWVNLSDNMSLAGGHVVITDITGKVIGSGTTSQGGVALVGALKKPKGNIRVTYTPGDKDKDQIQLEALYSYAVAKKEIIYVDIVSTIEARYKAFSHKSIARVHRDVYQYLGLPLKSTGYQRTYDKSKFNYMLFESEAKLNNPAANSETDAVTKYIDAIVSSDLKIKRSSVNSFAFAGNEEGGEILPDIGLEVFSKVVEGFVCSSEFDPDDILDAMLCDRTQEQLMQINGKLDLIAKQLEDIKAGINLSTKIIKAAIDKSTYQNYLNSMSWVSNIPDIWERYSLLANSSPADLPAMKAKFISDEQVKELYTKFNSFDFLVAPIGGGPLSESGLSLLNTALVSNLNWYNQSDIVAIRDTISWWNSYYAASAVIYNYYSSINGDPLKLINEKKVKEASISRRIASYMPPEINDNEVFLPQPISGATVGIYSLSTLECNGSTPVHRALITADGYSDYNSYYVYEHGDSSHPDGLYNQAVDSYPGNKGYVLWSYAPESSASDFLSSKMPSPYAVANAKTDISWLSQQRTTGEVDPNTGNVTNNRKTPIDDLVDAAMAKRLTDPDPTQSLSSSSSAMPYASSDNATIVGAGSLHVFYYNWLICRNDGYGKQAPAFQCPYRNSWWDGLRNEPYPTIGRDYTALILARRDADSARPIPYSGIGITAKNNGTLCMQ